MIQFLLLCIEIYSITLVVYHGLLDTALKWLFSTLFSNWYDQMIQFLLVCIEIYSITLVLAFQPDFFKNWYDWSEWS